MIDALNLNAPTECASMTSYPVLVAATGIAGTAAQALPIDLGALASHGIPGVAIALMVYFFLMERQERIASHDRERAARDEAEKKVEAATKRVESLEASIRRELLTINRETAQALAGLRDAIKEMRE